MEAAGRGAPCLRAGRAWPCSAPPASAARSARGIVDRHPSLELTVATARAEAGRRHDELYPRYAVAPGARGVRRRRRGRAGRRRARGLPAQDGRAGGQAAPRARAEGGGPVGRLPARPGGLRALVPAARGAGAALDEAVYGLPEAHRDEIAAASLVAGPGCNSTAALLATLPLRGRIEDAVFDIKAGVSGAGREATEETHYSSAAENVNAYKVEGHRHSAEIEQELGPGRFSFLTHLVPLDQGILASCYLTVPGPDEGRGRGPLPRGLRGRAVRGRGGLGAAHPPRAGHEPLPRARDRGGRPHDRLRRPSTTSGRAPPGRPSRT